MSEQTVVPALYKFIRLEDYRELREPLLDFCLEAGTREPCEPAQAPASRAKSRGESNERRQIGRCQRRPGQQGLPERRDQHPAGHHHQRQAWPTREHRHQPIHHRRAPNANVPTTVGVVGTFGIDRSYSAVGRVITFSSDRPASQSAMSPPSSSSDE